MAINFPASPTDGQTYTENGVKWKYNSTYTAWLVVDTPILANTSSGQVLYNYNDTIVSSNGISFSTEANTLYVNGMNVSSTLIVDGNVGIGTSSPTEKLHVDGNVLVTGSLSANGDNISPVQSFRNKIINGNFDFWQRGTTGTSGYVADRWSTAVSGSTAAISRQSFTLGQTDVPNEPTYFHRVVVTSNAGSSNFCLINQLIESVKTLAGQTATLSFWAKADASKNIAIEFLQNFGTGGSPSSAVNAVEVTTCALTTSWQKFTITVDVPSISGKTLGTNNNDKFTPVFWFDAGSAFNSRTNSLGQQSGTFDIAQVQLEAGSVATPFEVRPPGVELALCQRYYQTGGFVLYGPGGQTSGLAGQWLPWAVVMRTAPTVSSSSISYTNSSGLGMFNSKINGFSPAFTVSGSNASVAANYEASAEL